MVSQTFLLSTSLNHEGISHLEAENYEAAANCFSRGLALVKQVLSSGQWDDESTAPISESSVDEPACQFHKLQAQASPMLVVDDDDDDKDTMACQDGFVFKEPIMVLPQSSEQPGYSFFVKLSFIQLYNLALSHHLCALGRSKPERFLRKALALYELAYTIHVSEDVELTILQSMAIVNNLGHLHQELNNLDKARQCFENLLTTLMFIRECGEPDSHKMVDGFLTNVMPLILVQSKPAAAA